MRKNKLHTREYPANRPFLFFFSIIHTEMAQSRGINLNFKGSDFRNKQWMAGLK